ncbi:30S ribosomal protein S19, partial [Candidatus Woesearchaeota archaeon]|nr:30S ribosomal protein S19 [Candidatus Woesearchaeota archaeon]
MAKKEFSFRGRNLEELQALSLEEFMELLPSRERRSFDRGFDDTKKKIIEKIEKKGKVKTHKRDMIVTPNM